VNWLETYDPTSSGKTFSPKRRTCSQRLGRPLTSISAQLRKVNGSANDTMACVSPAAAYVPLSHSTQSSGAPAMIRRSAIEWGVGGGGGGEGGEGEGGGG
jgi:hypothetical protein